MRVDLSVIYSPVTGSRISPIDSVAVLASILLSRSYCWCSAESISGIRWIQGHKCCLSFTAIAKRKISDSDLLMEKGTSAKISSICSSAVPLRRDLFQPCWAVLRLFWLYMLFSDMKIWHVHYACCVWNSAPLCSILKVRYLCTDCGQRHKKFPFLKKKIKLILFTSLPPFFWFLRVLLFSTEEIIWIHI